MSDKRPKEDQLGSGEYWVDGAFSSRFTRRKKWKMDVGLAAGIVQTIPLGFTVADLGAGIGKYVEWLLGNGYAATGYDGSPNIAKNSKGLCQWADLSSPETVLPKYDAVISIEVGEHIPVEKSCHYLDHLAATAKHLIILSWAEPGQPGIDHVNCRPAKWVMREMVDRGWNPCPQKQAVLHSLAGRKWIQKLKVYQPRNERTVKVQQNGFGRRQAGPRRR